MSPEVFLFPGQGSQAVGMGQDLFARSELGRRTFLQADEILGYPLSRICFEGPEEELKLTSNTQPALLTVSYILFCLLGKKPAWAAGHSLGEYSALVCAGAIAFADAVLLVHKRGKYMQEAVPVGRGAMAALLGADMGKVEQAIAEVNAAGQGQETGGIRRVANVANWNSAAQVVISGEKGAVEEAVAKVAAARAVFLPVSAPFHSQLMAPAEEKLGHDLDRVTFRDPDFPVLNNVAVREVCTGAEAREGLKRQVSRPVLWHGTMEKFLLDMNLRRFTEIGTGKVLSGILKKTARDLQKDVEIYNIETLEDLKKIS